MWLERYFQESNWLKRTILIVYSPISGQYSYFIFFLWFSDVFSVHEKEVSEAATRGALLKSCS